MVELIVGHGRSPVVDLWPIMIGPVVDDGGPRRTP